MSGQKGAQDITAAPSPELHHLTTANWDSKGHRIGAAVTAALPAPPRAVAQGGFHPAAPHPQLMSFHRVSTQKPPSLG